MPVKDANEPGSDFDALMRQLAVEAQIGTVQKEQQRTSSIDGAEMLRPLVEGIQALGRAVSLNTTILATQGEQLRQLPELLAALQSNLDDRKAVSKKLFDALHEELRGYKDAFLFDALQKPMVRDLIVLYDDLSAVHDRFESVLEQRRELAAQDNAVREVLGDFEKMVTNVNHAIHVLLEILNRLEVEKLAPVTGKLDKQLQRVTLVEPAEMPEQDHDIVRSVKPGFTWRGRLVRAEEVVIRRFKTDETKTASEVPPEEPQK